MGKRNIVSSILFFFFSFFLKGFCFLLALNAVNNEGEIQWRIHTYLRELQKEKEKGKAMALVARCNYTQQAS